MPDPFDPIRGAWWLLLLLVASILLQQLLVFTGCVLGVPAMCTRTGETLAGVSGEVLAAVALLIALGRPPPPPPAN
jgi:hypothetical protein